MLGMRPRSYRFPVRGLRKNRTYIIRLTLLINVLSTGVVSLTKVQYRQESRASIKTSRGPMARLVLRIQGVCGIRDDSSRVSDIFVKHAALNPIPRPEEGHPWAGGIAN